MYAAEIADPFLWLEDVHGTKPLDWVQEQNQVAFKQLKADPNYQKDYDTILALLDADDRIPLGQLHGDSVFNFWQDPAHVRGIWRRTNIASYETPVPQWDTILDIDELARAENKSWVFKGATCAPDLTRCLVKLSPGGGDTVVLREFDPNAKRFVDEGFALGEAKAEAVYIDANTILFSTDFGPGTLTQSGYPRIVKLWRRGESISEAKIVFEGKPEDVIVSPAVFHSVHGSTALVTRAVSFFDTEYYYVTPEGRTVVLPLPLSAVLKAELDGNLIAIMRQAWAPEGQPKIPQGALIAFSLNEMLTPGTTAKISILYAPRPARIGRGCRCRPRCRLCLCFRERHRQRPCLPPRCERGMVRKQARASHRRIHGCVFGQSVRAGSLFHLSSVSDAEHFACYEGRYGAPGLQGDACAFRRSAIRQQTV
jgi:prolyl oligopeptidase